MNDFDFSVLARNARLNGGFTIELATGASPAQTTRDLWSVGSGTDNDTLASGTDFTATIREGIHKAQAAGATHVGGWVVGDTIMVESVTIVEGRFEATALGEERGEQAIYSLRDEVTLYL